jgi:hypothetical protein
MNMALRHALAQLCREADRDQLRLKRTKGGMWKLSLTITVDEAHHMLMVLKGLEEGWPNNVADRAADSLMQAARNAKNLGGFTFPDPYQSDYPE